MSELTDKQKEALRRMFPKAAKDFLASNGLDPYVTPPLPSEAPPIAQKRKSGPSQLQTDFQLHLVSLHSQGEVLGEELTLHLANGVRYTPDCWVITSAHPEGAPEAVHRLSAYEVKGPQFWDDAKVKLKVAARVFPWISFYLATREGRVGTPWKILRVLP